MRYTITTKGIIVFIVLWLLTIAFGITMFISYLSILTNAFVEGLSTYEVTTETETVIDAIVEEVPAMQNDTTLEDNVVIASQYSDLELNYVEDFSSEFIIGLLEYYFEEYNIDTALIDTYRPQSLWCFMQDSDNVFYLCEVYDYTYDSETDSVGYGEIRKLFRFEYDNATSSISIIDERGVYNED